MQLIASRDDAGRRLDQFLAGRLPDLSRSQIQRLVRSGHIRIAGHPVKVSLAVSAGLTVDVEIPPAAPAAPLPEDLPLSILYDDADLVVVDKPAGMVVHPGSGHRAGTLVNALLHHVKGLSGIGGAERPGIVHRLDRGTSGAMVVAKHDLAHRELARQFHDREVEKHYVALVWGAMRAGARWDQPIGRDRKRRQKMSTRGTRTRTALTQIVEVELLGGVSLVRVTIGTGRTHQIRVHLSESGHPIVGDTLYGGVRRRVPAPLVPVAALTRPFLHAARLGFTHPRTGERLTFDAPLAEDLAQVLADLRTRH